MVSSFRALKGVATSPSTHDPPSHYDTSEARIGKSTCDSPGMNFDVLISHFHVKLCLDFE